MVMEVRSRTAAEDHGAGGAMRMAAVYEEGTWSSRRFRFLLPDPFRGRIMTLVTTNQEVAHG
jgi:hypothetical protein